MISQNKVSKYLLYAIGEIALVMIGILLALQVNTWNENRKATAQEIKILKELKNDLEANLAEVEDTYNITNDRQNYSALILDYLETSKPVDDSLKIAFEYISNDGLFNNANTAYEYIKSQGVNVLSNDSLRIRISDMYEKQFSNIITRETRNWKLVDEELQPLLDKYLKASSPIETRITYNSIINTPKDIQSLRENEAFKNVIVRLQNWLLLRLNWQKKTLTSLELLNNDVQKEKDRFSI